jgi:septum formation protein
MPEAPLLILASKSAARRAMLTNAGISFTADAADLDEKEILSSITNPEATTTDKARLLACEKALSVAKNYPDALVIGADQILELDGEILTKAADAQEAKENLKYLRGKIHTLISAVCVVRNKEILWEYADHAALGMREFEDDFLDRYCVKAGDALTTCVGGYELEGIGVQLFSNVQGDYFTILGMPLLPLLKYLYEEQGIGL